MALDELDPSIGDRPTRETWEALARKALGRSLDEAAARTDDGIAIRALATRRDWPVAGAEGMPGGAPYTRGTRLSSGWDVRQMVAHPDPQAANAELLDDLAGGGTSFWLRLDQGTRTGSLLEASGIRMRTQDDLARVLAGVPRQVPIALDAGAAALPLARLLRDRFGAPPLFVNHDTFALAAVCGAAAGSFERSLADAAALAREASAGLRVSGIDTRPYHNAGATPSQELAIAAASGLAYLRAFERAGLALDAAARNIAFILVTDADFLVSTAKLRAFRRIWARILEACGVAHAMRELHVSAITSELMLTRRSAHTNILRTSIAAFAAALGGADAITVLPFTHRLGTPDAHARRIARNMQAILLEEAQLGRVLDPLGGTFATERLTEDLAQAAWGLFQEIEAKGGMAEALASGFVRERIDASWQARRKRIAFRQDLVTGISDFPVLEEAPIATTPIQAPARSGRRSAFAPGEMTRVMAPLPVHHIDEEFEALHTASDEHAARTGRPKIALICIGAEGDYGARAGLARSIFESAGIEAVRFEAHEARAAGAAFLDSGLRIAALASSDAIYAEKSLAFAHEIKRAGARYLYLIGAPGGLEAQLLDAGIDEFVREPLDAIALLSRAHRVLGLAT